MAGKSIKWVTEESVRELLYEANIPAGQISQKFIKFAILVAEKERRICADICLSQQNEPECPERALYCAEQILNHE